MASLLEQLRSYTTVVSDTGDFNAIKQFRPQDATTNPSLIAAAAEMPEYAPVVDDVLKQVRKDAGPGASDKDVAAKAFRPLEIAFGHKILEIIPGRVSTEVDARLSYDLLATIFRPKTPLHDGAVIVQRDRIAAAACFLPLSMDPILSTQLGTRHRAGIGITEETDAIAVIVSEETGGISLTLAGKIERDISVEGLRDRLSRLLRTYVAPAVLPTPVPDGDSSSDLAGSDSLAGEVQR